MSAAIAGFPSADSRHWFIYSIEKQVGVYNTKDAVRVFSSDERYCLLEGLSKETRRQLIRVLDTRSGETTPVARRASDSVWDLLWIAGSYRFAFADYDGNVVCGEVGAGQKRPIVKTWKLTKHGMCSDLRYLPGKGLYFSQRRNTTPEGYYSSDMHTYSNGRLLPQRTSQPSHEDPGEIYSPDRRLWAECHTTYRDHTLPAIRVRTRKTMHGVSPGTVVAHGSEPSWKK